MVAIREKPPQCAAGSHNGWTSVLPKANLGDEHQIAVGIAGLRMRGYVAATRRSLSGQARDFRALSDFAIISFSRAGL